HLSEYREGAEYFVRIPAALGQGWKRTIQLRPGLALRAHNIRHHHTHVYKIRQHSASMPLTFRYYLSGGSRVDNDGLSGEVEEFAGQSYLYRLPNTGEVEEHPAGSHSCLSIQVSPELIYGFCDRIDDFPTALRNTLEHPESRILYHPSRITSAQRQVLQQILEWPYQGLARHLYLESKALELVALHLNQVLSDSSKSATAVKERDIDRIYAARDILIQNVAQPPSLIELAQQVGLTEASLTRGFRQVFDTSVFDYLHNYRMDKACQLLQTGSLNIQEVALSVGYANGDSFGKAFKKKFRLAPSSYLQKI
ncbi:MAG: AraC family transcriptional regulator, partial [Cyanobacteria bacterium P01_F01_bin.13]